MSSMQSAPAHIPATTVASFGAGFADPDLILGAPIWTFPPSSRRSPVGFGHHHRHQPGRRSVRRGWAGLFRPHEFSGVAH
jgi:hypothetical protein